ncbi:MAG: radical SAM protein [Dehalococcoidales bacterium]|nr:radical SAM protein [Dehalococcoidales bacterium]
MTDTQSAGKAPSRPAGSPEAAQINYHGVTSRLLLNGISFRYHESVCRPLRPEVVSLALTHRCNSRCIMCNIWKHGLEKPDIKDLEMDRQKILDILADPLFSDLVELDLTGGEPHLRNDLVDLVTGISALKSSRFPGLRSIIITSNGFLTERITANYRRILEALQNTGIDLVSVNSLDGIGETHDRIRGIPGAYAMVSETLNNLSGLQKEYTNFFAGIKATILPENAGELENILELALSKGLFHIISPVFFTEGRFRNPEKKGKYTLGSEEYKKIRSLYSGHDLQSNYYYSQTLQFLTTGQKRWKCTAGYNYLFIEFDGQVYPCEMISEPVGNLKEHSPAEIWNNPAFCAWRKQQARIDRCRTCHEPGAIRYSAYTEGLSYRRFLRSLGRNKAMQSLLDEGYSKYFRHKQ